MFSSFLRGFHDGIIVTGGVDFAGGSGGESGGRHDRGSQIHAYNDCGNTRNAEYGHIGLKKIPLPQGTANKIVSYKRVDLSSRTRRINATYRLEQKNCPPV